MTDPYAGQPDADQTIPLVPDGGYALPTEPPVEATLVDPLAGDPWSSGPGLGAAAAPTAPIPATPDPVAPVQPAAQAPAATPRAEPAAPAAWPQPAAPGVSAPAPTWGYPLAADYGTTSAFVPPAPLAASSQPAPVPPAHPTQRPLADAFPEPDGPVATIGTTPYAASPYAGQQWPATIPDPVNHDYGYAYGGNTATDHPNATPSLILGIIGLALFLPAAPVALYLASKGLREARYDPARWRTGGTIAAGRILGIIGTVLMALIVAFFVFVVMAALVFRAS